VARGCGFSDFPQAVLNHFVSILAKLKADQRTESKVCCGDVREAGGEIGERDEQLRARRAQARFSG
jgi:hypothetical protein